MATVDDAIKWSEVLEPEVMEKDVSPYLPSLTSDGAGTLIHTYLRQNYNFQGTTWEEEIDLNGEKLRYDCSDENFIYEFKTKSTLNEKYLPEMKDVKQLQKYLDATDTGLGFLVYISRDDFEVKEYPITSIG